MKRKTAFFTEVNGTRAPFLVDTAHSAPQLEWGQESDDRNWIEMVEGAGLYLD